MISGANMNKTGANTTNHLFPAYSFVSIHLQQKAVQWIL